MSTTDDTSQDPENAVAAAVTELDNSPVTDAVRLLTEEVQRLREETKTLQHRVDDLEAERDDQAATIQALEVENRQLRERVTDLEQELAERPDLEWAGPDPKDLAITSTEAENTVKPYRAIRDRVEADTHELLEERVQRLEDGEANVVVRGEFDGNELPIERKITERKAGGDLSANKARATLIFPKFGGHAETRGGSQLVLSSGDVRAILRETTDRSEWPNETIKRAMTWTAKLTSHRNEKREWDARDDENLLTLRQGRSGELELVADVDEYREYYAELEEAQE